MAEITCRNCKRWKQCPFWHPPYSAGKEWYHFGEIRWCPFQVLWILENAHTLEAGRWPPEHCDTGYEDRLGGENIKTEAGFVKPELIIAEVKSRLNRTGLHGKLLVSQVEAGRDFDDLDEEAKAALMYVKGWRRKKTGFKKWLTNVYYRHKSCQNGNIVNVK